jgi:hypothetical protein
MVNKELLDYVKSELSKGVDTSQISGNLLAKGWSQFDVDDALNRAGKRTENDLARDDSKEKKPQIIINNSIAVRKPVTKWLVLLIIILAVSAAGYYGYFEIYLAPEKVFARSMNKMQSVTSVAYEGTLTVKVKGNLFGSTGLESFFDLSSLSYLIDFSGESEFGSKKNIKFSTLLDVDSRGEGVARAEIRNVNEGLYLLIHKLADISTFGFFDTNLLVGRWIDVDINKYEELISAAGTNNNTQLSSEQIERYANIIVANNPIENLEQLASEEINGVPAYHYKYLINRDSLKEIIILISEDYRGIAMTREERGDFDKSFNNADFYGGEMWIGKKDGYVRKHKQVINVNDYNAKDTVVTLSLEISFDKFNQPFVINVPDNSISIEDLFKEITESLEIPVESLLIETPDELPEGFDYKMFELDESTISEKDSGFYYPLNVLTRLQGLKSNIAGYSIKLSD